MPGPRTMGHPTVATGPDGSPRVPAGEARLAPTVDAQAPSTPGPAAPR